MAVAAKKITKVAKKTPQLEAVVYRLSGEKKGVETLDPQIFGQKPNNELIAQYVRVYQNNQRQGTASTKTRAEVSGTTQKVYRQKGTGRARHGAAKANLFRGGGVTFGPKPKKYALSLNKKQRKQALFIALSQKAKENKVKMLDASDLGKNPKTKQIADFLKKIDSKTNKVLFILSKIEKNPFVLSARNIANTALAQTTTLNTFAVLNSEELIFVDDSLVTLGKHFLKTNEN